MGLFFIDKLSLITGVHIFLGVNICHMTCKSLHTSSGTFVRSLKDNGDLEVICHISTRLNRAAHFCNILLVQ